MKRRLIMKRKASHISNPSKALYFRSCMSDMFALNILSDFWKTLTSISMYIIAMGQAQNNRFFTVLSLVH